MKAGKNTVQIVTDFTVLSRVFTRHLLFHKPIFIMCSNWMQYYISDIHFKKLRNSEVNLRKRRHTVNGIAVSLAAGVEQAALAGPLVIGITTRTAVSISTVGRRAIVSHLRGGGGQLYRPLNSSSPGCELTSCLRLVVLHPWDNLWLLAIKQSTNIN